jgi:plastocyanin
MALRIACATLLLTFTLGCGSSSDSPPSSPTPAPGGATSVSIVNGSSTLATTAYAPNPVTIAPGGTITWRNNDTTAHTSTGDNGEWNSGSIAPGGQFSRTFPAAGTFSYHCTIHPNMIGTVRVQ